MYKVEQYLSRCINSILAQTFTDFELLLIDDGSPDKSGEICDEYALKDSRIRVFHKENGGVSSARNLGLDNANGEWITFIDSDDWVQDTYLSELHDEIIVDCDIIVGGYQQFGEEQKVVRYSRHIYDVLDEEYINLINNSPFFNRCIFYCPWGKLFKLKIIKENGILFDENMFLAEDTCFMIDYMCFCNNIGIISNVSYMYFLSNVDSVKKYLMSLEDLIKHVDSLYAKVDLLKAYKGYNFFMLQQLISSVFFTKFLLYAQSQGCASFTREIKKYRMCNIYKSLNKTLEADYSLLKRLYYNIILYMPRMGYFLYSLRLHTKN